MTAINNFDQSSTGTDIEFNAFYDCMQGRDNFSEHMTQYEYNGKDYWVYNPVVDLPTPEPEWKFKKELSNRELLIKLFEFSSYADYRAFKNYFFDDCHWRFLTVNDFYDVFNDLLDQEFYHWQVLDEVRSLDFITVNYEIISTQGYSQGDYCEVIIVNQEVTKELRNWIDHLFWDAPIWGELTIDGSEFYVTDYHEQYAPWDKDDFMEAFIAIEGDGFTEDQLEQVRELLPSDLETVG
jgi:hypothetical protein